MSPVPIIKAAVKYAENFNLIIYDSPPGTSCPFIHTVNNADYVILVSEPTPFGLSDLKQSVETLKTMKKKCGVIINRCDIGDNKIKKYLDSEEIPILMEIPYSKDVAKDYSSGKIAFRSNNSKIEEFFLVFKSIYEKYGISNYQR